MPRLNISRNQKTFFASLCQLLPTFWQQCQQVSNYAKSIILRYWRSFGDHLYLQSLNIDFEALSSTEIFFKSARSADLKNISGF